MDSDLFEIKKRGPDAGSIIIFDAQNSFGHIIKRAANLLRFIRLEG